MTEPSIIVLGGICVAVISGAVGKVIGGNKKISNEHCEEKQKSCQRLMIEKIENLGEKVDSLTRAVNNKLLGL